MLHPHLQAVRNTPHGKRIHNKILKQQLLHDLTNDACAETPTFLATSPCTFSVTFLSSISFVSYRPPFVHSCPRTAVKGVTGKYFDLKQQVEDKFAEDKAAVNALVTQVHKLMGLPEPAPWT